MKKVILTLVLASLAAIAWALPTVQDVEAQVKEGHYAQAESMMREVVAAKPDSAKAHYIYAEILAHDGKVGLAAEEARRARQIDPDVKFTDPEKFRSFEAALQRQQAGGVRTVDDSARARAAAPAAVAPARASSGIPSWVWLGGLAVIAFVLWRGFARSRDAAAAAGAGVPAGGFASPGSGFAPGAPGAQPTPYGPGYPAPGYPPQRAGSGMLGTGLAAAGGVAAGMLASELLHRRHGSDVDPNAAGQPGFFDSPGNGGGALEDRPIDFGSGGDWDAGGGGSDLGGGSDGGGGGWD